MKTSIVMPPGKSLVNKAGMVRLLEFLMAKSNRRSGRKWGDISLVLTNDDGIRKVNRLHLGHNDTTDVITYAYPALPGQPSVEAGGELFVNMQLAKRLGPRFGGVSRELALYVAHGCDHLAGEEDSSPEERRRMRRRELRWIAEASRMNLLTGLIPT
jgi:rRNA maturation RNase YbeY